jgi:hypothetical protein
MRIIAEWEASPPGISTFMYPVCEAFEGETIEEIDAKIRARAGTAAVRIVGLRNTQQNFEVYAGYQAKSGDTFADTPSTAQGSWFARLFRRIFQRFSR